MDIFRPDVLLICLFYSVWQSAVLERLSAIPFSRIRVCLWVSAPFCSSELLYAKCHPLVLLNAMPFTGSCLLQWWIWEGLEPPYTDLPLTPFSLSVCVQCPSRGNAHVWRPSLLICTLELLDYGETQSRLFEPRWRLFTTIVFLHLITEALCLLNINHETYTLVLKLNWKLNKVFHFM